MLNSYFSINANKTMNNSFEKRIIAWITETRDD